MGGSFTLAEAYLSTSAKVVTMLTAKSSCRVWIGSQLCQFGISVFDSLVKSNSRTIKNKTTNIQATSEENGVYDRCCWQNHHNGHHYDRTFVGLKEKEDNTIELVEFNRSLDNHNTIIPFGRARECPELDSTACPTTVYETQVATTKYNSDKAKKKKKRRPYVELAVVGMLLDPTQQYLLITRRPSYMRSFPGAWVFPGGTVDKDESLEVAMSREMKEEVGIHVPTQDWKFESIWESVYPTIPQLDVPIKRHHIVIFLSAVLQQEQQQQGFSLSQHLDLCQEEVAAAAWLSRQNAQDIANFCDTSNSKDLDLQNDNKNDQQMQFQLITPSSSSSSSSSLAMDGNEGNTTSLKELIGIYPQPQKSEYGVCGMGQGSLFALEEFLHSSWRDGTNGISSKL